MVTTVSQKIKIGIFVVVGLLILVAGIFLIGARKNMFSSTYKIYGTFRSAGGLQSGNNIRFGGVNIGTVEDIRIISDTVVRVDMIIQSKMKEFIKSDAIASIGSDGLMGDKLLVIAPGTAGAPILPANGRIITAEPVDFAGIITQFSHVASNAEIITNALAQMALQIKSGDGSISRLLYQNDLADGLQGTINNARAITGSLQGMAVHIQSGRGSLGSLIYTDSLSKGLENTIASIQVAADNFAEDMKALQGNYFFRGYFKKKAKSIADSLENLPDPGTDIDDTELEQIREDADRELRRRHDTSFRQVIVPQ